jgi:ribosomal protein L7Ae-like RNA K-turn-binding protein
MMGLTVRDTLRRLADLEPDEAPVLSVYLDMRPQATGERPAVRSGLVVLKDRLREIEKTLLPRGAALDSFRADAARIQRYLDESLPTAAQGLAIFACTARNLFEVVEAGIAFENEVAFAPVPDLFQLARLADNQETAVVAVVDTNTARLFVMRTGFLEEIGGPDDAPVHYGKRRLGALNQARYQRHIEKHRAEFAQEAAAEIERVVEREGAMRVILAGDEVAIPLLRAALSPRVASLVHEDVLRIHIRAPRTEVEREVEPVLAQAESDEAHSLTDQLVSAVQSGGLGVAGEEHTRAALEHGQVDMLLLAPEAEVDAETRNELIRLAAATSAGVELVERHPTFQQLGGVGALLRYRHDEPVSAAA